MASPIEITNPTDSELIRASSPSGLPMKEKAPPEIAHHVFSAAETIDTGAPKALVKHVGKMVDTHPGDWWIASLKQPFFNLHNSIEATIASAREYILSLKDGWDGEGGLGYEEQTFDRAACYLRSLCTVTAHVEELEKVRILPGSDGGVDLHWEVEKFELLITFEHDGSVLYYGDDYGKSRIEGETKPCIRFLNCWMESLLI